MTASRSKTVGAVAFALSAFAMLASAAGAIAAPDRVKVGPDLYLQKATATGTGEPSAQPPAAASARSGRIVNGFATTIAEFPWQVGVAFGQDDAPGADGFQRQFCGGTLVSPTVVITAAHCVYDTEPVLDGDGTGFNEPPDQYAAITGRTTLSTTEGVEREWADYYYFVDGTFTPLYNPATSDFDAIFVELVAPGAGTPVKIAGADETATWAPGRPALISGWGDTASGAGDYQDTLRAARIAIIADSTCTDPGSYGALFHPNNMLCAGAPATDACQGDSGGPLVVPLSGGEFRLVGDTSWGFGCADPQFPGIYGRIAGGTQMGDGLDAGIQAITGENVFGSGGVPMKAPDTTITKAPKNKIKTKKKKVKVTYAFTNAEPSATSTCDLDGKVTAPCASPFTAKVKKGRHAMTISSTNPIADVDATPATDKFKVKRKKKRKKR
jgi:hypothetical protein